MKFVITENQLRFIEDFLFESVEKDSLSQVIRDELKKIYKPLNLWGKAPNPNDDCETDEGVINIFPHSEDDVWSVLNKFDTNKRVKKELENIFISTNPIDKSFKTFVGWLTENSNDLFGPNGKYTKSLININMGTIVSGDNNERYSIEVLKNRFPDSEIKRFCAGDNRDRFKGMDLAITRNGITLHSQVKPFQKIISFIDEDGDTFFEVTSYGFHHNRYKESFVDLLMFVDTQKKQFIIFQNKKQKIAEITSSNTTRFYEPPLYTNMVFETKSKRKSKNIPAKFFDAEKDRLKNIEFRLSQMEKLKQKYKG